eukprot:CAMPEP_0195511972 /NCGR_PEP_ID=MMETSP0794_2-20130614/4109_1 /TAXON_ID=515487 /ORGANISM="Stephanopyxis turris, Strain CCMP 815" /LENGTH=88 /DNA_ID=CAMNT_0040639679 /DNA_START=197 /DNA_END=466 /DNA_ORIENTATION=-
MAVIGEEVYSDERRKWEEEYALEMKQMDEEIMDQARRHMAHVAEQRAHLENEMMESNRIKAADERKIDLEREKQKYGHLAHEYYQDEL